MLGTMRVGSHGRGPFLVVPLFLGVLLAASAARGVTGASSDGQVVCPGDCDGSGAVTIDELVAGVNMALGDVPSNTCSSFDADGDGRVTISELVMAVTAALSGCDVGPAELPTPRVEVQVAASDGTPVDGFSAQFDERAGRVTSSEVEVAGDSTFHALQDAGATVVVIVRKPGFHDGLAVLDPPAVPEKGVRRVDLLLVPEGDCLSIAPACADAGGDGPEFVPGEVFFEASNWLWPDEVATALAPYCLDTDPNPFGKRFSMWVDVFGADPAAVIEQLDASDLVSAAFLRGYGGSQPVAGETVLVSFLDTATINAATRSHRLHRRSAMAGDRAAAGQRRRHRGARKRVGVGLHARARPRLRVRQPQLSFRAAVGLLDLSITAAHSKRNARSRSEKGNRSSKASTFRRGGKGQVVGLLSCWLLGSEESKPKVSTFRRGGERDRQ